MLVYYPGTQLYDLNLNEMTGTSPLHCGIITKGTTKDLNVKNCFSCCFIKISDDHCLFFN